jgi:hypothetical protein
MEEADRRFPMTARLFRAPLTIHVLLLAFAGWSIFRLGVALLGYLLGREDLCSRFAADLVGLFVPLSRAIVEMPVHLQGPLDAWLLLALVAWAVLVWAFFGIAICRAVAVRIARDEILPFSRALRFAWRTKVANLLYPAILFAVLLLLVLSNGVAGLLAGVPWIGPIFLVVLLPLVLLASLIFTLVALGGVLGLGIATSSLATERNGTLDAISRTYSYLFSQPLYFLLASALAILFARLLYWVGHSLFLDTAIGSLGFLHETRTLQEVLDAAVRGIRGFERLDVLSWIGARFVWIVVAALRLSITALVIGYLLSAGTYIYFILREEVDGVPFDDIDLGLRADDAIEPLSPAGPEAAGRAGGAAEPAQDAGAPDEPDAGSGPADSDPPGPGVSAN